jgi:hypothetical protein
MLWFHKGNQDKLNRAKTLAKERRTDKTTDGQWERCSVDMTVPKFQTGLKKRIKSRL